MLCILVLEACPDCREQLPQASGGGADEDSTFLVFADTLQHLDLMLYTVNTLLSMSPLK